jgi:hypothetical protein
MTLIQKADAGARRRAVILVAAGGLVFLTLMAAVERYRLPLHDWLLSDPDRFAGRLVLVSDLAAAALGLPLLGFALYLWAFGAKVMRAGRFPLPGQPVIRDTPVLEGREARARGRVLKVLAACLGFSGVVFCLLFWRLIGVLGGHAA